MSRISRVIVAIGLRAGIVDTSGVPTGAKQRANSSGQFWRSTLAVHSDSNIASVRTGAVGNAKVTLGASCQDVTARADSNN